MAITRINTAFATAGSVSSLNCLLSSGAVTAGNSLILHYSGGGFGVGSTPVFNPTDNVNTGAWSTAVASSISVASAPGQIGICYRLAISSGAIASTYRISFAAFAATGFASMNAFEYSGVASFDKAGTSSGVSSSPTCTNVTAANANSLWSAVGGPFSGSTLTARSTGLPTAMSVIIVDQNNANQMFMSGELITSSLALTAQQTFRIAASNTWMANVAIFAPTVGGGATAVANPWTMAMTGIQ